jgi:hypothetical protein
MSATILEAQKGDETMRVRLSARAAIIGFLCLGGWLAGAAVAWACECVKVSSTCMAAAKTPAVFVGRVVGWVAGEVLFEVERPVRGVKRGRFRVDAGSGNCAASFEVDERYVVYAHWDAELKALTTSKCSPTRPLSDSQTRVDLNYFDRLERHQSLAGFITGVVYDGTSEHPAPNTFGPRPIAGVVVSASAPGERPRTAKTGRDGIYEFKGMPTGTWTLTATLPPGFPPPYPQTVELTEQNRCDEAGFYARWVGADAR